MNWKQSAIGVVIMCVGIALAAYGQSRGRFGGAAGGALTAGAAGTDLTLTPGPLKVGASGISTDGGIVVTGGTATFAGSIGANGFVARQNTSEFQLGTVGTVFFWCPSAGCGTIQLTGGATMDFTNGFVSLNSKRWQSATATTVASGFNWGSITSSGTQAMAVTIGAGDGGAADTSGVLTFAAATGSGRWGCSCDNATNNATSTCSAFGTSTTSVTVNFYSRTTGLAAAPTAGDVIELRCGAR